MLLVLSTAWRRLRTLHRLLGQEVTFRLVSAYVLWRPDYCNTFLIGLSSVYTVAPLQRVMHVHCSSCLRSEVTRSRFSFNPCPSLASHEGSGLTSKYISSCIKPSLEELHLTYRISSRRLFQFFDVQHCVLPIIIDLVLHSSHRKLGDRAFSVAGPRWFTGWFIFTSCQHINGYIDGGLQPTIFPGGHTSKYSPWSTLLDFGERATELALVATPHLSWPSYVELSPGWTEHYHWYFTF